jgi:hypothetical protein
MWAILLRIPATVIALFTAGCILPGLPPAEDVRAGLSRLILRPQGTCEDLRDLFGLEYLPIADTPGDVDLSFEEHWVAADNGEILRVWYLPSNLDRGLVVLSNGNTGSMACHLFTARLLVHNGWSAVMYDYEGFGESSGSASIDRLAPDLARVVEWALEYTGRAQVSLYGISLGTVPTVAHAASHPDAVNGLMLDSPVSFVAEIERFAPLAGDPHELLERVSPDLDTTALLEDVHQPLLMFLHERDALTPPSVVEDLYARAAGPRQLVRFPGLQHAFGQFYRTDVYTYALESFLTGIWTSPRGVGAGAD